MKVVLVEAQKLRATVAPDCAGRVATLSYGDRPLLVGPEVNADNWGSTYWTSPQSEWGWPPLAGIDSAAFEMVADRPLRLCGPRTPLGTTHVRLEKQYTPLPELEALDLEYTLVNVGQELIRVAGWEISRVASGGLTFYPTGAAQLSPVEPHGPLTLERHDSHSFYDHTGFVAGRSLKVHADGRGGYLAHATAPGVDGRRLVFLKLFPDSLPEEQAPGEGEVEIFANEDGAYVEVEVQGPYRELLPGARTSFTVRWVVRELPPEIAGRAGSTELIEFARALARQCAPNSP